MIILGFSTGGIMGWPVWKEFPLISCTIVAGISLIRLISPHIIPSEKQIDKLDEVTDFYFDYLNKIERLWFDYESNKIDDEEFKNQFYMLKDAERSTNKIVNEIIKTNNRKLIKKAETETINYLTRTFNT